MQEEHNDSKHVKVTLVWGGTGESKTANIKLDEKVEEVFNLIYKRFHQQASDQDTFEINEHAFSRSEFNKTIAELLEQFGMELTLEVIPPTSGAW